MSWNSSFEKIKSDVPKEGWKEELTTRFMLRQELGIEIQQPVHVL